MLRRPSVLLLALVVLLASGGCSVLDAINRLPGTLGGSRTTSADYSKVDQMPAALTQLRAALKGDDDVVRLTMGTDGASVTTMTQSLRLVDGAVGPDSERLTPVTKRGVALASLDPAAAMTRLSAAAAQRGCTDPTRIALTVYATGQVLADVTCTLGGEQVQLVEGPKGDLLGDLDLTTRAGITKAFADVTAVTPPNSRYTTFAFQYDTSSGVPSLLTITGRVSTLRASQVTPDVPVLFQADTGVDPIAKDFDIAGITADTFVTVYEAAKKKCGSVSVLHLVLATNGQPMFLSGTFSCPYQADRTGKPI